MITALAAGFGSCGQDDAIARDSRTPPASLCRASTDGQYCLGVHDAEKLIQRDDLEIVAVAPTPAGIQGAKVLTVRASGGRPVVFRAKWRAHTTATTRNSPRYELAAYEVQKLFLLPPEYVVPPTAPHCFPLDMYRARVDKKAKPTFPGTACVYGVLSYWLEDVQSLADARAAGWFHGEDRHALDPKLFARSAAYRDSVARVNLLTYLIGHGDSHAKNFVITRDPKTPVVYSVDNSLSLGLRKNSRLSPEHDWSRIKVPALPRDALRRLRAAEQRLGSLATLAVLENQDGQLFRSTGVSTTPTRNGFEWKRGRLQIGLIGAEIEGIRRRLAALLATVDRGEILRY